MILLFSAPLLLMMTLVLDLEAVRSEPQLEKRAQKAIDYAGAEVSEAREAYQKGEVKGFESAIEHVVAGADLTIKTLEDMGKHPSKNVKNYKLSEKRLREVVRRLDTLKMDVGADERPLVEKAVHHLEEIHEKLLEGALSRKP